MEHSRGSALFREYVEHTKHVGQSATFGNRAAMLLRCRLEEAAKRRGMEDSAIIGLVEDMATARLENRPAPIYVIGLAGSSSGWPVAMIAETLSLVDVGEALIPPEWVSQLEVLDANEQGLAVDCLHLIHALALNPDATPSQIIEAPMVNSAMHAIEPRHRAWDPECFTIHLLRDPRDRATELTFCRRSLRDKFFPGLSDDLYLAGCADQIAREFNEIERSPVEPDFVCHLGALKASATSVLTRLAASLGRPIDDDLAKRAVCAREAFAGSSHTHRAGGPCNQGWRVETNQRQRTMLHSRLVDIVAGMGYAADDCLGQSLELEAPLSERRLSFGKESGFGILFTRKASRSCSELWTRHADACGEVVIPGSRALKLRVSNSASRDAIASLAELAPDGLQSLCLAGNPTIDDGLLGTILASLRGIQELDLSRTAVTHAVLPALEELPRLRSLNVAETALGPGDTFDLRTALGPAGLLVERPLSVGQAVWRRRSATRRSSSTPKALVTGCPRSGTSYLANVLGWAGVASGHESVYGPKGNESWDCVSVEVSWLAAPFLPVEGVPAALQVRDPLAVVRSLVGTRFFERDTKFLKFAEEACPQLRDESTPLRAAVRMWCKWTQMAEAHAVDRWRVEDAESEAERIAAHTGAPLDRLRHTIEHAPRDINHRNRASDLNFADIPAGLWADFEAMAVEFGYEVSR